MDDNKILKFDKYELSNLGKINIILGKNGCGKSTLLRKLDEEIHRKTNEYGKSKYITPERGGVLVQQSGIEDSINRNSNWLSTERRKNQSDRFRQQVMSQYRRLEITTLRQLQDGLSDIKFHDYIEKINSLLDHIEIRQNEGVIFDIFKKTQKLK